MKKVFIIAAAFVFAILAFATPPTVSECECKNNPSKNDGTCIPITGDNTRTGYRCVKTGGNVDCYETTCESSTIGGGTPSQ
jgi:hypothetical protein